MWIGPWIGQGEDEECSNPKMLRESITSPLEDFQLDSIVLQSFDNRYYLLSLTNPDLWTVKPFRENGNCYTLKVPKEFVESGISTVNIRSRGFKPLDRHPTKLDLFIHDHGLFLNDLPHGSSAGMRLEAPLTVSIPVDHEIIQLLDYDGHTCASTKNYHLSDCRHNVIFNVSFDSKSRNLVHHYSQNRAFPHMFNARKDRQT